MLRLRSRMTVADNTGARMVYIIGVAGKGNIKFAPLGTIVTVVVNKADPYGEVKKGEIVKAVIIRTKKENKRKDGSYIRFDDNACVVVSESKTQEPRGTRVFGPVAREIKELGFSKIASLASEVY